MGHLDQARKKLQSTKINNEDYFPSKINEKTNEIYYLICNLDNDKNYMDLMGNSRTNYPEAITTPLCHITTTQMLFSYNHSVTEKQSQLRTHGRKIIRELKMDTLIQNITHWIMRHPQH